MREGDVAKLLRAAREGYDAVLLDVDNGPKGLVCDTNNWLYSEEGLSAAFTALRSGGILAVWAADPCPEFRMGLRKAGFEVQEHRIRVHAEGCNVQDSIWIAKRPA